MAADESGPAAPAPADTATSSADWVLWSAAEREDFLDAVARHRRNAWRVTIPCALASLVLLLVLSVLLAPLLYTLLGLGLDLINLVFPAPDLLGSDDAHALVMVGTGLLIRLERQQMQGVAGHLVASVADGDMRIGIRTAMTLGLFALPAAVAGGWSDRTGFAATSRLLRALMLPTPGNLDLILQALNDPFRPGVTEQTPAGRPSDRKLTWREWAMMPLMGPVMMNGFLGGLVSTMMLAPAVALAWRHRKFMADANAVRLTRDPNALAGALAAIGTGSSTRIAAWARHLCVIDPGVKQDGALLGGSYVSVFPLLERRLKALVRLGANPAMALSAQSRRPVLIRLLLGTLIGLVGVLLCVAAVLLVWVSLALSGLFTVLPGVLVHALLR